MRRFAAVTALSAALAACTCSKPDGGSTVAFPEQVGDVVWHRGSSTYLMSTSRDDGGEEACLAAAENGKLLLTFADATRELDLGEGSSPLELDVLRRETTVHVAVSGRRTPYLVLRDAYAGNFVTVSETGSELFFPQLAWSADGSELLLAQRQGLDGCSEVPLLRRCSRSGCTTRCLGAPRATARASRLGGVVLTSGSRGFEVFAVGADDGGTAPLNPVRTMSWDAGHADYIAVAPDGQRAVAVTLANGARLVFFSPVSADTWIEREFQAQCSVEGLQARNAGAMLLCLGPSDGGFTQQVHTFSWEGTPQRAHDLAPAGATVRLASHHRRLLSGVILDGGIEIRRLE